MESSWLSRCITWTSNCVHMFHVCGIWPSSRHRQHGSASALTQQAMLDGLAEFRPLFGPSLRERLQIWEPVHAATAGDWPGEETDLLPVLCGTAP
jgi:hypothetical protein